jgi:hypothetical protein
MSQQTSAFDPIIRRLERHAAASIHENTDLLTVVRKCDFSTAEIYEAGEIEWNARYGCEPMVRAFYCKDLTGITTEVLHEYLADQFAPGKTAPGRTTLGRAWRDRLPRQLKAFIQTSAERILGVAHLCPASALMVVSFVRLR